MSFGNLPIPNGDNGNGGLFDNCVLWLDRKWFSESYWWDVSPYKNNGIIHGAKWKGDAFYFNGADAYIEVPHNNSLNITDAITIETWIRLNSDLDTTYMIVEKGYDNPDYIPYFLRVNDNRNVVFGFKSASYRTITSTTVLTVGEWYHIVGTWDGSIVRIYVNTILKASTFGTLTNDPNQDLTIGRASWDPVGGMFKGTIDEVRIYNRSLTQEEINDLYNYYGYTTPNYLGKVLIRKYTYPEPTVIIGEEEY